VLFSWTGLLQEQVADMERWTHRLGFESPPVRHPTESRLSVVSDLDGSNALVATVQFYSQALARMTAERDQLQATLRQVMGRQASPGSAILVLDQVARAADNLLDERVMIEPSESDPDKPEAMQGLRIIQKFQKAVSDYRRAVDRVEPDPPREGQVRGAPADGPADVPG
jgi:hypothetical protein